MDKRTEESIRKFKSGFLGPDDDIHGLKLDQYLAYDARCQDLEFYAKSLDAIGLPVLDITKKGTIKCAYTTQDRIFVKLEEFHKIIEKYYRETKGIRWYNFLGVKIEVSFPNLILRF